MVCNIFWFCDLFFALPFPAFAPTFFVTLPVDALHLATLALASDEKRWRGRGHCCLNSVWVPRANGPYCNIVFLKLLRGGWGGLFFGFEGFFSFLKLFSGSFVPMVRITNCLSWHFWSIHCSSSQVSCFDAWKTPLSCFLSCTDNLVSHFPSLSITETWFLFLSLLLCRLLQMNNLFSECYSPAPSQPWWHSLLQPWTVVFAPTFFPFVYWDSSLWSEEYSCSTFLAEELQAVLVPVFTMGQKSKIFVLKTLIPEFLLPCTSSKFFQFSFTKLNTFCSLNLISHSQLTSNVSSVPALQEQAVLAYSKAEFNIISLIASVISPALLVFCPGLFSQSKFSTVSIQRSANFTAFWLGAIL